MCVGMKNDRQIQDGPVASGTYQYYVCTVSSWCHGAELIISNIRIARYTIWRYKTNLGRQPITQASIASKQQRASQMLLLATKKIRTLPQSTSLD